jgi:hypothetical protein
VNVRHVGESGQEAAREIAPKRFSPEWSMTEDPLTARQRHFEEQYGKFELPGSKSKKIKRGQIDVEPQEEVVVESEEEWLSVRDDTCALEATVITFTEHHEVIEESPVTTHKSFMVNRFLEPAENSPPRSLN